MKSTDADPPYETLEIGTPKDYSSDMYRYYFEVGENEGSAQTIIQEYLGPDKSKFLNSLPHGYEIDLAIQCVPDLVSLFDKGGIGIYQVVRVAKLNQEWE